MFFEGQSGDDESTEELQLSSPERPGGGRGRVNLPPRRLVWRFWEVWRVCYLVAERPEASADCSCGVKM